MKPAFVPRFVGIIFRRCKCFFFFYEKNFVKSWSETYS